MQSGTVPVERLRASLKGMFPTEVRHMSLQWFNLLAKLTYFRYNYRHFHAKAMPSWTDMDSLLAERIEDMRGALCHAWFTGPEEEQQGPPENRSSSLPQRLSRST